MKKIVAVLVLTLLVGLAFSNLNSKTKEPFPRTVENSNSLATAQGATSGADSRSSAVDTTASATNAAAPKTAPPIPRDETPQVIRDWSTDLGRSMLGAFKDEAKSDQMFSFLRTCAEDQSLAMVYRAVCAGNAKRFAEKFPERYSQNFGGFQRGLPERIQKFLAQAYTNF